ncbi:MAG: YdhR family protein, partial [Gammaproteobacteria bacterium]
MSAAIVQINFDIEVTEDEMSRAATDKAPLFNGVDGLLWKIWLVNEDEGSSGGIYLFRDRASAEAYAGGDLVTQLRQQRPNVSVSVFDIMEQPSRITRAPLPSGK